MGFRTAIAVVTMLALTSATSGQAGFSSWVPEEPAVGTPIWEYEGVPFAERSGEVIEEEDLVFAREDDPNYLFYRPKGVAVDADGRVYVLDSGNQRVQVFDAEGAYVRTLGSSGRGPGELSRPSGIALVGDHIAVFDFGNSRLTTWDLEGHHVGDVSLPRRPAPRRMSGMAAGHIVVSHPLFNPGRPMAQAVSLISVDDGEMETLIEMAPAAASVSTRIPVGAAYPSFASWGPNVFVTPGIEYQIFSIGQNSVTRWALRAAWNRLPFTEALVDEFVTALRKARPGTTRADLIIPERLPAIAGLRVDGHGHLYVFLQTASFGDEGSERISPVDVYDTAGRRLFSGMLRPGVTWDAASGDFVYATHEDAQSAEIRLVRFRLIEPF